MLIPVLALLFLFSTVAVIRLNMDAQREQDAFETLASSVRAEQAAPSPDGQAAASGETSVASPADTALPLPESSADEAQPDPTVPSPPVSMTPTPTPYLSPYLPLKEENEDFFGWLSIEGTKIDYPVMYTPDDPEYYLHRAFDRSASKSGVPFLDAACSDEGGVYLIYGHNMKNGTMFASLFSYAKKTFWQEHPSIRFDTLAEEGTYAVLAAFYTKVYAESETGFRFYQTDLSDEKLFYEYIEDIKSQALYDTGISAEYGDQILVLATCSYHTDHGRFVVVARKEDDERFV